MPVLPRRWYRSRAFGFSTSRNRSVPPRTVRPALTSTPSRSSRMAVSRRRVPAIHSVSANPRLPMSMAGPETAQGPSRRAMESTSSGGPATKPSHKPGRPKNLPNAHYQRIGQARRRCQAHVRRDVGKGFVHHQPTSAPRQCFSDSRQCPSARGTAVGIVRVHHHRHVGIAAFVE